MNSNEENTTEEQKIEETLNKKYVCSFNKLNNELFLKEQDQPNFMEIYYVSKTKEQITVGDIIKLGECIGFVLEEKHSNCSPERIINSNQILNYIQVQNQKYKFLNPLKEQKDDSNEVNTEKSQIPKDLQNNYTNVCRICLEAENEQNGPLHQLPCECKGTQGFIHEFCFFEFLQNKILLQLLHDNPNHNCLAYKISKVYCEICKNQIPEQFLLNYYDKVLEKLPNRPNKDDYLIITFFSLSSKSGLQNLGIFVVTPDKHSNCYIGRKKEFNHLQLKHLSISRLHCEISFENNKFFIFDRKSRFGTMKQARFPINVTDKVQILQVGSSIIGIKQINSLHNETQEK